MSVHMIERIQKMLAKAASTTSEAEAAAIMEKVSSLLEEHGLGLADLSPRDARSNDPVETQRDVGHFFAAEGWMRRMSSALATYCGVRIVWTTVGYKTRIHVVGRESCRAVFIAMMPYLRTAIRRLAKAGVDSGRYRSLSQASNDLGKAMTYRLFSLAKARQRAEAQAQRSHNALVPYDEIAGAMQATFGDVATATFRRVEVSAKAIADAETISLNDQIHGDRAEKPRMIR